MKAWEWLEQHKWIQGQAFGTNNGETVCACAIGAIAKATENRVKYDKAVLTVAQELVRRRLALSGPIIGNGSYIVVTWNDAPGRTKEEVVALLKELDI